MPSSSWKGGIHVHPAKNVSPGSASCPRSWCRTSLLRVAHSTSWRGKGPSGLARSSTPFPRRLNASLESLVTVVVTAALVACGSPQMAPAAQVTAAASTAARPAAPPAAVVPPAPTRLPQPATATLAASAPRTAGTPSARVIAEVAPRPVGVLTDVDTEIGLLTPLPSADLIRDIARRLRDVPGILELRGDEHSITVIYDTAQATPTRIREAFAQLGYPVRAGTEVIDPGIAAD